MNLSGIIWRIIIAVVIVTIAIALLNALNTAFGPAFFSTGVVHLLDVCFVALGVLYVFFGATWNTPVV